MAESGSGDEYSMKGPTRKKSKGQVEEEEAVDISGDEELNVGTSTGTGDEYAMIRRQHGQHQDEVSGQAIRQRHQPYPEEISGHEGHNGGGEEESEYFSDTDFETESEEETREASTSAVGLIRRDEQGGGQSCSEYHRFAPPSYLQKLLSKRQGQLDRIRQQYAVRSRNQEQKLEEWYNVLSRLDKPVALLSLISSTHHE